MMEFLEEIKTTVEDARATGGSHGVAFPEMINVLVMHAQSDHVNLQIMSAKWILEFLRLSKLEMLPHVSGILMSLLPNLVFDDDRRRTMTEDQYKKIQDLSNKVNLDLMKLVKNAEKRHAAAAAGGDVPNGQGGGVRPLLELESLIDVLTKQLQRGQVETKLAVLRWIYHLFKICQQRVSVT